LNFTLLFLCYDFAPGRILFTLHRGALLNTEKLILLYNFFAAFRPLTEREAANDTHYDDHAQK
jgi:hypothetical protein